MPLGRLTARPEGGGIGEAREGASQRQVGQLVRLVLVVRVREVVEREAVERARLRRAGATRAGALALVGTTDRGGRRKWRTDVDLLVGAWLGK